MLIPSLLDRLRASLWPVTKGRSLASLTAFARLVDRQADIAANVSLQAHLHRIGFESEDFFVDGGAASPTLQLVLVKILALCQPQTILELGSGQTTKVLNHHATRHPSVQIVSIEEDAAFHAMVSRRLEAVTNHHYLASPLIDTRIALADGRTVDTRWYADAPTRRFELILIDGPTNSKRGYEYVPYSRIGILPHLNQLLAERFVIVIDDTDNYGYAQTAEAIKELVEQQRRDLCTFSIYGVKSQMVICSPAWSFLRSV